MPLGVSASSLMALLERGGEQLSLVLHACCSGELCRGGLRGGCLPPMAARLPISSRRVRGEQER